MHLARTVVHATLRETKQRMSSREFEKWKAQYRIMPWGDDWLQTGTIAASMSIKRVRPEAFIPKPGRAISEQQAHEWARRRNQRNRKRRGDKPSPLSDASTPSSQPQQARSPAD